MRGRILIIKTGASGDVVRTTILLHLYKEYEIDWVTKKLNTKLLPSQFSNLNIYDINDYEINADLTYDLVISLDDEENCAQLASAVSCKELIGVFIEDGIIKYKSHNNTWFDMSLVSVLGIDKANELKEANKVSFQNHLFNMLGHTFNGEEYCITDQYQANKNNNLIGIEARAGNRWPTKVWNKYKELQQRLEAQGYEVKYFTEHENIVDYVSSIAECKAVVSGDTLAMHLALGIGINTVSIFTCTSSTEIFDYNGRLKKIVSPYLKDVFYKTDYSFEAVDSISVEEVYEAVIQQMA